jgi:biuret amidohydrolase
MKSIFGLEIPSTLDDVCAGGRLALLVYDMQVGIVGQVHGGNRIVEKVREVLAAARKAGMRVFFTRHLSLPLELMGVSQFRMAMAWQRVEEPSLVKPWFLRDSPAFAIVPELTPLASEAIFDKIAMSAFEGTPLHMALRDCGVAAIAVVGLAMEVGIEPTVRHAADLGLAPVIVSDACGAGHPDPAQRSLESLAFAGDALITDSAAFIETIERSAVKDAAEIDRAG